MKRKHRQLTLRADFHHVTHPKRGIKFPGLTRAVWEGFSPSRGRNPGRKRNEGALRPNEVESGREMLLTSFVAISIMTASQKQGEFGHDPMARHRPSFRAFTL